MIFDIYSFICQIPQTGDNEETVSAAATYHSKIEAISLSTFPKPTSKRICRLISRLFLEC